MSQQDLIFEVGCPNCGKVKKARRNDDGKRVRCSCGAPFSIKLPIPSTEKKLLRTVDDEPTGGTP